MSDCREQVEAVIRATRFHSPTTYSWFGKLSPRIAPQARGALSPSTARKYILYNLQNQLYHDFYCIGAARPSERRAHAYAMPGMTSPFARQLSEANAGRGYWESGWEVTGVEDDRLVVQRGDLQLRANPAECKASDGGEVAPSAKVSLRFPKEFLGISPSFYMALSDLEQAPIRPQRLVRFYWNLTADGAVTLMNLLTAKLNQATLPFRLKTLNDPNSYVRCDAAVLYISKDDYAPVRRIVESVYPQIQPYLKQHTPAFTKQLALGLGLAEDIVGEESFGQHRCRLLAEGMLRAHEGGKKAVEAWFQSVEERFIEEGVSLQEAYLTLGSVDDYGFNPQVRAEARVSGIVSKNGRQPEAPGPDSYLQVAKGIGRRILQEAIWHENQCNWLGAELLDGGLALVYKALGPDLYNGSAGIALFLAELCALTGDPATRRTALGAIEQALAHTDELPPNVRLGLYSGWTGVAYAAVRIGMTLGEASLLERASSLVKLCVGEDPPAGEYDLISGSAGAIVALVSLAEALGDKSLITFAARLGDGLLEAADKRAVGYSWKSSMLRTPHNLTGLSHGAAGIGCALLELHAATGDARYREAAERAFDYERHWFDASAGNWPDLREMEARLARNQPLQFMTYWCHGAPGVALSRLRAYALLGDERYRAEAVTALQTTQQSLEQALHTGSGSFSLCHGVSGNAEALLLGSRALGPDANFDPEAAYKIADMGVARYQSKGAWPSGVPGGDSPTLMLGQAGVGLFYLSLHDPSIPSILLPVLGGGKAQTYSISLSSLST